VSVITAHQAMAALSPRHLAVPVYIAKDGGTPRSSAAKRCADRTPGTEAIAAR